MKKNTKNALILQLLGGSFFRANPVFCVCIIDRALVSVGAVGAQHPQIFLKTEFAPTDFEGYPS